MILPLVSLLAGLALLVWSADRFVDGAAATARYLGMPPLLIGMVIVGFGTSAPEMLVSCLAALQGNPGIALGNAYGSNIANIALILGVTALISPLAFHSNILRKELPILTGVTVLTVILLFDRNLSRTDAWILLALFVGLMGWSIYSGMRGDDKLATEVEKEIPEGAVPLWKSVMWLILGLVVLIASSRLLVWGAVAIATKLGVSDLVIGLTIVAVGTSLPELASSIAAARKGEHEIALGNVLGSNLFNTLAVVGIAGSISPFSVPREVLTRDMPVMGILTLSLFLIGYGFRGPGRINRFEGGLLLLTFIGYNIFLLVGSFA